MLSWLPGFNSKGRQTPRAELAQQATKHLGWLARLARLARLAGWLYMSTTVHHGLIFEHACVCVCVNIFQEHSLPGFRSIEIGLRRKQQRERERRKL